MDTIQFRKKLHPTLALMLNRRELKLIVTATQAENLNTLIKKATILTKQGMNKEVVYSLFPELEKYHKDSIEKDTPKATNLKDIIKLYLSHSETIVTPTEQRRRVAFFTNILPAYWKELKIPVDTSKVNSKHLYALSQHMAIQPNPRNPKEPNKPQTVNRYIKMIRGCINWGLKTGLYSLPSTMPTLKLNNSLKANREPLKSIEYETICRQLVGGELLLFQTIYLSGMRNSEVYKLTISEQEGVPVFNLLDTEDKLKTSSSHRIVPIHSKLLEHIIAIKSFSKQDILRLSRSINKTIKELYPTKSLYSARHSVVTRLIQKGVDVSKVQALIGHSSDHSMTMGVYFGGYDIETLRDVVELL